MNDIDLVRRCCPEGPGQLVLMEVRSDLDAALLRLIFNFFSAESGLDKGNIVKKGIVSAVILRAAFSLGEFRRVVVQRLHVCVVIVAGRLFGNGGDLQLDTGRDGILVLQLRSDGDVIVLIDIGSKPLLRKHEEKLCILCEHGPFFAVRGIGVDLFLNFNDSFRIVRGGPGSVGAGAVIRNLQFDLLRGSCLPDLTDARSVRRRIEVAEGGPVHVKETAADHDIVHRGIFRIIQDKRLPEAGQLDVCVVSRQRLAELVHVRNRRDKGLLRHVVKDHAVQNVAVLIDLVLGIGPGRRSFRSGFAGRGRCRPYRVGTGRGIPRLSCIQHYAGTGLP